MWIREGCPRCGVRQCPAGSGSSPIWSRMPCVSPRRSPPAVERGASGSRGPRPDLPYFRVLTPRSKDPAAMRAMPAPSWRGQGEDHTGGAEGCGQPDRGPGEGAPCARVLRGGLVRRVRLDRRCSVRLLVIRVAVCGGHGKPSLLVRATARGEWVMGPWTGGELAAQVRWLCPVAPPGHGGDCTARGADSSSRDFADSRGGAL